MIGSSSTPNSAARALVAPAYAAFGAFGSFWGAWGASIPRVQARAGLATGQLGLALLFVGAGALPAMLLTGRALDRWGLRVTPAAITTLGVAGAGTVSVARSLPSLCAGLALVGAASGAADVAMNAVIGRAEKLTGRPVITRAHGLFSLAVVASSIATGLASGASLPPEVPFLAVALTCVIVSLYVLKRVPTSISAAPPRTNTPATRNPGRTPLAPLVLIGVLGALAFAGENAHQSWAAVYAREELHTSAALAATAPAIFAATVAVARLSLGTFSSAPARTVLLAGAAAEAVGAAILAVAPSLLVAILGLVLAGAGTAVLFPTLLAVVARQVDESRRGRATSIVTTVSYLGFLLGPVYVGAWADAGGLRTAMLAIAALGVALFLSAPSLLRISGRDLPRTPDQSAVGDATPEGCVYTERG